MKFKSLAVFTLFATVCSPIQSATAEWNGFSMLRDCKNTPNQPCIESISATTSSGKVVTAILTGRTAIGDGTAPANIDDEYQLPGLNFEAPAGDKMVARVFYDGTMFQTVFEASWVDQTEETRKNFVLLSPHRETNLNCGTLQNRQVCYRNINFNQDLTFHQVIRVPKTFITAYVNGRTDSISYRTGLNPVVIDGIEYASIDLTIHVTKKAQVLFSDVLPNPLTSSDWADSEIDQTIANFFTPQNPNAQRLGPCSGIPAVSVISNGINPDVPTWDPVNQTMSVQVWGPHFKVSGDLNAGFFQARISKEIAKCLWNLDVSSATKAQITLTEQGVNGADVIETIAGNFDGQDYVLTDANFHYSAPRISVKLINEPALLPTGPIVVKDQTPLPSIPKAKQSKSITCIKGKSLRKLTGLAPKCPPGYKIKR
jgi:hypothetical protein